MNRTAILEILDDWNHWHAQPDTGTPREAVADLASFLDERHILAVTGVRRCGKSTLMRQLGELAAERHDRNQVLHVNFEDPRWLPELGPALLDDLVEAYREQRNPTERAFLFLDEIQAVPDWERWVRAAYDRHRDLKMVISGSTASLIGGTLGTLLTGRHISVELYPFSLRERLLHEGVVVPDGDYYALRRRKTRIRAALAEQIEWGGFPETCGELPDLARVILQQYFEDIVARDVLSRRSVRDARTLKMLAHYSITNIGNELSSTRVAKTLGVSTDTVREYFGYLQEAYLVSGVSYASPSLKVVARRNQKTYAVDCGLRNVVSLRFSRDAGRLAENLVFLRLKTQGVSPSYWRNGGETDFVVETNGLAAVINVCFTDTLPERETRGLECAMSSLNIRNALIVSDNLYREAEDVPLGRAAVVPLWYFLIRPLDTIFQEAFP